MLQVLQASQTERERALEQVQQAQQMRSLGALAAGVAHEINNPLNNLELTVSGLQMLLERNPSAGDERVRERLGRAAGEIDRIQEIVRHMRSLVARPEEVHLDEPVEMRSILVRALALVGAQLGAHGIRLEEDLPEDLPAVRADPRQFEQVLVHLLTNAMQALDGAARGDKRIRVRGAREGRQAILEMTDNGPGLGEHAERIFEPFFTTKDAGGGMGLGLSLVHAYIASWGGEIRAGAAPEGGARFTLRLRVFEAEDGPCAS